MLFPGLMLTGDGPKVLEFNCRFGDPETQVLVRRLSSDLLDLLEACVAGTLADQRPEWDERAAVCVVLASRGYPGAYKKGKPIEGLEDARAMREVVVFHAGTKQVGQQIFTNGGRVLGVTAIGADLSAARERLIARLTQSALTRFNAGRTLAPHDSPCFSAPRDSDGNTPGATAIAFAVPSSRDHRVSFTHSNSRAHAHAHPADDARIDKRLER